MELEASIAKPMTSVRRIFLTGKLLNQIVYRLHGLTKAEITAIQS